MPRYEYSCAQCDYTIEKTKSFSESDTVELCEKCGNEMNKVYGTVGVQFKGSGFYKTDNAK
jgi:putative FmdB family regulatory protein